MSERRWAPQQRSAEQESDADDTVTDHHGPLDLGFMPSSVAGTAAFGPVPDKADDEKKKQEVIAKVDAYVTKAFGGDLKRAFTFHSNSKDQDGMVSKDELKDLLKAAKIGGGGFGVIDVRGMYADAIIDELDTGNDGKISWKEFDTALRATAKTQPAVPSRTARR